MEKNMHNGMQKPEEIISGPDFICDPVPYEYRKYYERRKGRHHVAAGIFAAAMIFVGVILNNLLNLLGYDGGFSETVRQILGVGHIRYVFMQTASDLLRALVVYFLPLFGLVKWHAYLTEKTYGKKIKEYGKGWYAGTFTPEFLVTENQEGERKFYYYNDIASVEETAESYHIACAGEELTIPKMYLDRDSVRSVRHHLMRYCGACYEQSFVEEQDSVQLVIPWKDGSGQQEIEKGYMSYVRSRCRFYYTETKMWLLGLCLCYLLRLAMGDFSILSIEARVGLVIAVLVIPISRGTLLLMAKLAVKKRRQRIQSGTPVVMEIGKSGFYYQNDEKQKGNSCGWTSWGAIKEICEGKDFIIIGKVYFDKKIFTKDQMGQIRALCQKYAGRKYHFIGVESQGFGETARTFMPILCYVALMAAVFAAQNGWRAGTDDSSRLEVFYKSGSEEENQESENDAAVNKQGSREPIYVLTPDKNSLYLTATAVYMNDCYSSYETNETGGFYISADGILYGASSNRYGELGLGNTDSYMNAKGFYQEMEVARGVKHVALGNEFMIYLTDSGVLMGTGNLPAAGSSYVPVELMEDVQYAKCSDYGMIILKEDGSVWCAGTLYDEAGNVIREYSGFEQVMDHAVFATAGARTMAVIQTDGTLWMWGDNGKQQCGVNTRVAGSFAEPVQVREGVRMVWPDRLSFSSSREYPEYLAEEPDPYVSDRTYIVQEDGETYACGEVLEGETAFVKVMVSEE